MKLERSISNLSKRLERFDPSTDDRKYWKGKEIIPLEEWIKLKVTSHELKYFPDDFNQLWTFKRESELKDERTEKWRADYLELMEHRRNSNYGRSLCFKCLLSPHWEESAIFIGINKLIAKGLEIENNSNNHQTIYPCKTVNRFECPYEKGKTSVKFDVDDLFDLKKMAFAVEIALAIARKDTSKIQIKDKQKLYHVLTNRETLCKILEQALDYVLNDETFSETSKQELCEQYREGKDRIICHFMNVRDKVRLDELRFY